MRRLDTHSPGGRTHGRGGGLSTVVRIQTADACTTARRRQLGSHSPSIPPACQASSPIPGTALVGVVEMAACPFAVHATHSKSPAARQLCMAQPASSSVSRRHGGSAARCTSAAAGPEGIAPPHPAAECIHSLPPRPPPPAQAHQRRQPWPVSGPGRDVEEGSAERP
ncbi:hypothetical protein BC831DRAFT_473093 [Entophlyctis helioformis]|nr:hypothetical protein BC831DRAFT_473093 [Entophlyctis helioformis]